MIRRITSICIVVALLSNYISAQTVTASQTDSLVGDHQAIGIANPNDTVRYKTTISVSGADASGVNFNNAVPTNTTMVAGSVKTSALCRDDVFATSYNTLLNTGNVLTNDYGLPSVSVVSFGTTMSGGTTTSAGNVGTTNYGGTLTVNANGTFSYQPMTGFSGMDQFTYIGTTGVAGLQNGSATVTINVATDITFTTMDTNPACNGASTGSIVFSASGGTGALTYSITGAMGTYQMSPTFSGLMAGSYNLAVKDAVNYIKTGTTTLTNPPLITFTTMDVHNMCNGDMAGSITFSAMGGTGTLMYSITGAMGTYQVSNVFTGLAANTYNLAVKDANNCIVTGTTIITQPSAVTFTFTKTDITCNGAGNGSIVFNTTSGGTSPYTYSITGTMGTFTGSTNYMGLSANTYNLVAKDNLGCNSMIQSTTVVEPAAIVVSGTIPNLTYNVAMSNATFTKTGGTGSPANPWSATGLPTGVTINTASGIVSGTPTQTGAFNATITYTDVNGCFDDLAVSFTVAPNLQNNTYANVVGNTQLVVDGHSTPTTPFTTSATNILTNDQADVTIIVTAGTFTTSNGQGSITIAANGKFTYTPGVNLLTADSYTYTGTANGVSATATINFTITNMIWYVNNTYAGANGASDGRSHRPYTDVASAEAASAVNQIIYIHSGSGNTTGNALLKTGQTLRGAGSALNVGALSIAAAIKPTLAGMITLANSVAADGFDMNTGAITAITSSGATGVTVSVGNITTSGPVNAVTLTNTTGSVTIAGGTLTGGAGAVFNVSGGSATIACAAAINQATAGQRLVNIQSITGGSVTISGNLSSTGTSTGINVSSCTGGTITFGGSTKTLNTPGITPITMTSNAGTTINFTGGGLAITSTTATGFNATGGGTISVTGAGNTITSTTGTALNVANTTIGASGLNFQSISSSGGANGIVMNNVSGNLTVTGDGSGFANGSGGSLSNITGGVLGNAPVYMLNCSGTVTLKSMNMSLNTNCYSGMLVDNNASGNVTVNVTGCTFIGVTSSIVQNKSLLQFEAGNAANITANVQNSYFSSNRTYGVYATGAGTSIVNVTINQCGFGTDIHTGSPVNNPGTTITNPPPFSVGVTNGSSSQVDYLISNNTFWGADGSLGAIYAVAISGASTTASSHLVGTFSGNKIGKTGVVGSGASNNSAGLGLLPGTGGLFQANVLNNDIRQVNSFGINFKNSVTGATGTSNIKIKGNLISEPDLTGPPTFIRAIVVDPGNSGGASMIACAEIGGSTPSEKNTISGSWQAGFHIRVTNNNNSIALRLPGLSPSSGATAIQVNSFVESNNILAPGNVGTALGTSGIVGGSNCF